VIPHGMEVYVALDPIETSARGSATRDAHLGRHLIGDSVEAAQLPMHQARCMTVGDRSYPITNALSPYSARRREMGNPSITLRTTHQQARSCSSHPTS
jgi:hypothetical protein